MIDRRVAAANRARERQECQSPEIFDGPESFRHRSGSRRRLRRA